MDSPRYEEYPRPRSPFTPWLLVAFAGVVIAAASVATAVTTDSRDFVARQQAAHGNQAL
jgi:hypothetical protein